MTALATRIRPFAVGAMRALPRVPGWGRLAAAINEILLEAGADSVAFVRMTRGYSMVVDCRVFSHSQALFSGSYDDEIISALAKFLRPGGTALDVGAQIGFYTVPLARAAQALGGRVIAVEPLPKHIEWLRRNLVLNGLDSVVTIIEAALSSERGESRLSLREDFAQGAAVGSASVEDSRTDSPTFERIAIRLETLDDLWPALGCDRLDVIKVDIEGHEDRFLAGGKHTILAHRPAILTEVCRWFYEQRGVDFDSAIMTLVPPDYCPCVLGNGRVLELASLRECNKDDVFLVPREKLVALR